MPNSQIIVASAGILVSLSAGCSHEEEHTQAPPSSVPIAAIEHDALFVINGEDSTISVINTETSELAGTITLKDAAYPHHVYMSDDRSKLLVAVPGVDLSGGHSGDHGEHAVTGAVLMLDAITGRTLASRRTDTVNHNAVFAPGGQEVWTAQMASPGSALVLDGSSLEIKQSIPVGDRPAEVTFSPASQRAWIANGASNSVTVIDPSSKTVVQTIAVGQNPVGAWQGNGGITYVDNEDDKTLTAIDTQTLDVLWTHNLGFTPGMVAVSPEGDIWVADPGASRVVIRASDMDAVLGEVVTEAGAHAIAFSGDGTTAYVSNQTANTISIVNVAARNVVKTIAVGKKPNGVVWRAR